ncbi:unnamed protein product [Pocillopora meandrina]|uniref:RING-type domain-containing protein n=1 Tax=Pocillopora meandrina TaxID=46732 RepID=A0AAU9WW02_9CNID|nr:unnamed protein product [Pocillopora meandrina]
MSPIDDDLLCLICQLPLREPVLTRCGHRFCRQCLEQHLARSRRQWRCLVLTFLQWQESQHQVCNCPVDREKLERSQDVFPDKATERKILSFTIKCRNEGCEWTGELREKRYSTSLFHRQRKFYFYSEG